MHKAILIFATLAITITSCSQIPSDAVVETAIAKTDEAQASSFPIETNTPLPTETQAATPTPTPDLRVINLDPNQFLLTKELLPKEGKYYLPASDWISPLRNYEIVSGWGVEEGREYLAKTGRVDGWEVFYLRGSSAYLGPEEIADNVVLYKTAEGALLVMTEYSTCINEENDYVLQQIDFRIGDTTNACIRHEMQPSGVNRVWYRLELSYRNMYHGLTLWGWDYEIDPELAKAIAADLVAQLENADLSAEVTFSP